MIENYVPHGCAIIFESKLSHDFLSSKKYYSFSSDIIIENKLVKLELRKYQHYLTQKHKGNLLKKKMEKDLKQKLDFDIFCNFQYRSDCYFSIYVKMYPI